MSGGELRFDGRVAVITGAGAGLGREYALLLASRGAKVVVNDLGGGVKGEGSSQRSADIVVAEIKALGGVSVPDYNSVIDGSKIIETAINNFGRVDILINNAGILRDRSIVKMTEEDWKLVQDVHLKGSFKCTQAAFPYMRKQNYGRIIMTSSTSGIFGNFGQTNYAAAKMGLVGLANTVAIEGQKYNILCNVIIPTAASRMTEGILPDLLFKELKPQLIAPVVVFMCHETYTENGSYIQSAAGWATKWHMVTGKGTILRSSIEQQNITPEHVKMEWAKVVDMSEAKHLNHTQSTGKLVNVLEKLQNNNIDVQEDTFKFGAKDLILYALGIGASVKNSNDLKFLYENHYEFAPIPTFFISPCLIAVTKLNIAEKLSMISKTHYKMRLHGEQYLEICDNLPTSGTLTTTCKIIDVMDKSSGAVVVLDFETFDENSRLLVKNQMSSFILGAGNFGGKRHAGTGVTMTANPPNRLPDSSMQYKISDDQAAVYRLSGDLNPLHIDPKFAADNGFKQPILHGLSTLGFSVRAVLAKYANNNPTFFKAVKVRFSAPVIPGQTLKVDMWKEGRRIHFHTSVLETGANVITGAYVDLKNIEAKM
ncbi:peroxisomal multifunctional enzyme type 2-like [Teleopsis dalmanni]|uniref:peroxisomal multifunctional enzyme type 2-like n=1 Tax=Teleopsis dalmanni TaxID=139649 RepID=UPI0018CD717C|nr:peroxisomal multifunctional enzyme type 2-like [Teleopsis dalmanni]